MRPILSSIIVFIAVIIGYKYYKITKQQRMELENNTAKSSYYVVLNDFVSPSDERELMTIFENMDLFESSGADFSSKKWTDIGEWKTNKPTSNGSCIKHGLLMHKTLNKCLFFPRLDVVRHYMMCGGYEGWKERIPNLTSRISFFINHEFHAYNRSEYKKLFEHPIFVKSVSKICPKTHPYFKPIELNLVVILPGQGFPAHHDAVYFVNATRHQYPLWLLSIMKESTLFKNTLLPQVQGIVYISKNNKKGGELYFYPNSIYNDNDVVLVAPKSKSAVLMDGTDIVHGTTVYQPHIKPLPLWPNTRSYLKFDKISNVWRIYIDNKATQHIYEWDDVRGSMAYRALCFDNKNKMNEWTEYDIDASLSTDAILEILKNDLIERNRTNEYKWNNMNKYELGLYLMEEYVKLPRPTLPWIQTNYCIILDLLPSFIVDSFIGQLIQGLWC